MALTTAQIATLHTFVLASADAEIIDARTRGDTIKLSSLLNAVAPGPILAWNTSMSPQGADEATPWTSFDTLDATAAGGKKMSWQNFFNYPRDFSKGPIRKWITDVWGSATGGSNAESILQAGLVNATVAQNAIGGSTATTGTVSALKRNFDGQISQTDAQAILA